MTKVRKVQLAWKYRKYLWRYRKLLRHRREIAAALAAGAVLTVGIFVRRHRIECVSAQRG
jgi:hypothetical protein